MHISLRVLAVAFALALAATAAADVDLEIAPVERTLVERVTESPHVFTVDVAAEEVRPFSRNFVPDDILQSVTIEGPAERPRLLVEGMPDMTSAEALLGSVMTGGMSDFEKALAIMTVVARFGLYSSPPSRSTCGLDDPIVGMNCAAGICGNFATWNNALARKAGLPARIVELTGHTVSEVFYDGRWHMFDPTTRTFFVGRDNRSVASARELERDPDLMRRAGAGANLVEWFETAADNRLGTDGGVTGCTMDVTLRPGETLTRKTDKDGPSLWNYEISREERYASGALVWKPDIATVKLSDIEVQPGPGLGNLTRTKDARPMLVPDRPREPAQASFDVWSPYPITKATLRGRFGREKAGSVLRVDVMAAAPGMCTYSREAFVAVKPGVDEQAIDLTPIVFGTYGYSATFTMESQAAGERTGIESLAFENVVALNPYSLPHLTGGKNKITYVDAGKSRDATVTWRFREKLPLTVTPWPPIAGRTNTLRAFVRNRGTDAAENVEVEFKVPYGTRPFTATATIPRIGPGETAVAEALWRPARPFRTWIQVTADPKNVIRESDEKNNTFSRGFRLVAPADLSVSASQITVQRAGGKARIEALVVNVGGLPARDVEVEFLTEDGKTGRPVGRAAIPVIDANNFSAEEINVFGRATLEVDAALLAGSRVGVVVDPEGKLDEAGRENNVAWTLADEPAPDPLVFFSFEPNQGALADAEIQGLLDAREVEQNATHGKCSALLVYPAARSALLRLTADGTDVCLPRSWGEFTRLRVDVTNATGSAAPFTLRLLTMNGGRRGSVSDATFELPAGKSTVEVPLAELKGANLDAVEALELVVAGAVAPVVLYVDNLRLVRKAEARIEALRPKSIRGEVRELGSTGEARAIPLDRRDDLRLFSGTTDAPIVPGFPGGRPDRAAVQFAFAPGRSVGLTLELTRPDSPWPMDWRNYKRLAFEAQRTTDAPFELGVKIRSSHPEHGVKLFTTGFALRKDGARCSVDLAQLADRLDLDSITHVTWYVWRPGFAGTYRVAGLKLEK